MTLSASSVDPSKILYEAMRRKEFAGKPVLILAEESLPEHGGDIEAYIMSRIDGFGSALSPAVLALTQQLIGDKTRILQTIAKARHDKVPMASAFRYPYVPYASVAGRDTYVPSASGIVVISDVSDDMSASLYSCFGLKREANEPLILEKEIFQYQVLMHELMHLADAAEPQAEKGASLFTRRAFPTSPVPLIGADIRAVVAIRTAFMLATNLLNEITESEVLHGLKKYGWAMVEANDQAQYTPDEEVALLTDQEIIDCRFDRIDQNPKLLIDMATRFVKAIDEESAIAYARSTDMFRIASLSNLFKSAYREWPEPAELAVSRRFFYAAQRSSVGAPAYYDPAVIENMVKHGLSPRAG